MKKEEVILGIKQRIIDEQRKHSSLDWAEIAARKIYSSYILTERKKAYEAGQNDAHTAFHDTIEYHGWNKQ